MGAKRWLTVSGACLLGAVALGVGACSGGSTPDAVSDKAPVKAAAPAPRAPNFVAGPVDRSQWVVQHLPDVQTSRAERSARLRDLVASVEDDDDDDHLEHPVMPKPKPWGPPEVTPGLVDPVAQLTTGKLFMPDPVVTFPGQGTTLPGFKVKADPPDTNGAVGPNHYVQTVNESFTVFDKKGNVLLGPNRLNTLWAGYVGTNPGNECATFNGGDPIVMYDQLADRWWLSQLSYPGGGSRPPAFECVAVSETGDPTGSYFRYDYSYDVALNDYPKFGVWPDAYYGTYNLFNAAVADLCAFDRLSMLRGAPAAQQCFKQKRGVFGAQPASLDGKVPPAVGEPGIFVELGEDPGGNFNDTLELFTMHVDWQTPANSSVTGPLALPVASFTGLCERSGDCVPQPSGDQLAALGDRLMYRLAYRNYGTHEALTVNHSVQTRGVGGVRWYELRSTGQPAWSAPTVYQQGTYAPVVGDAGAAPWRWMASLAEDQAQDFALGFSLSSPTQNPSVGWTGRLETDPLGKMAQGEADFDFGTGVESGGVDRWGDYSSMNIDPVDDCTFWYTQMLYDKSGGSWASVVASSYAFPSCAANDFSIALAPGYLAVDQGNQVAFKVKTKVEAGSAESIILNVQDLPAGVTATFTPPSIAAGESATLTLAAASTAPLTASPVTFMVIGTAPSALHPATADLFVGTCTPVASCPAPEDCGKIDNCGTELACGNARGVCRALDECHEAGACTLNLCTNPDKANGTVCSIGTCQNGVCTPSILDGGSEAGTDGGSDGGREAGTDAGPEAGVDAGREAGTDAGPEAGVDAGREAGTEAGVDAGHDAGDSGTGRDSGTREAGSDSGGEEGGAMMDSSAADATSPMDASAVPEAAVADAASLEDAVSAGDSSLDGSSTAASGQAGGCGCTTVGAAPTPVGALGLGGLLVLPFVRRRRSRAA